MSLYSAAGLPVLQNVTFESREAAKASATGDLTLGCDEFGILRNKVFDPNNVTYDGSYDNEQSFSQAFRNHMSAVVDIVAPYVSERSALEIGCGEGFFLEMLRCEGLTVRGIDPAYTGAADFIEKAHFNSLAGKSHEFFILRHVLEHIPNPTEFLQQVERGAVAGSLVYIEVPCLDWIVEHGAWFDIFYEHVNYFRMVDLMSLFANVIEQGRLFGGQYVYVIAELSSLIAEPSRLNYGEGVIDNIESLSIAKLRTVEVVLAARAEGKIYVWGAASKGVMVVNCLVSQGVQVAAAVDINPRKQGRYLPVSGVEVISPESFLSESSENDLVLIMNSQYSAEIKKMAGENLRYIEVDRIGAGRVCEDIVTRSC